MKRYAKLIEEEWQDEDGYWISLAPGLMDGANPQCHGIHEDTKKEAYACLSSVVPCTCPEHRKKIYVVKGFDPSWPVPKFRDPMSTIPKPLFCMFCGKYSKPEDANNLNCKCGGKLIEVSGGK